jgi:hypothetical protein
MSRSFAYLGLPWINLYIGELVLAVFLVAGPRVNHRRWVRWVHENPQVRRLKVALVCFLLYGGFEAARGISQGNSAFTALRDTAFNYYPLFLILGLWAGYADPDFLRRIARTLAVWNACYGIAYVLVLNQLPWFMPGTSNAASPVPVFSEPYGSAIAILGLLAFEPNLWSVCHWLSLNVLVMLWVQVRAEWVGFAAGLLVFAVCTRRVKRFGAAIAVMMALVGIMYIADVRLPSPEGRGGVFSVRDIVARALAPVNNDLATDLATADDSSGYSATASWRLLWWASIWEAVHSNSTTELVGFGYGYPIGELNPLIEPGTFIQTPHNDFFFALGFTGWIGVFIFLWFQYELFILILRVYRQTERVFPLICWSALVVVSIFEDFFEAPFGAIPFFLLMGAALAPLVANMSFVDCRQVPGNA